MKSIKISKIQKPFTLTCDSIASDKSISHRCAIFSLLSDRPSQIDNFLMGEDTINSLEIAKKLGAEVHQNGSSLTITPPKKLREPDDILDCGNAGTGMRLYCGLLCGVPGSFVLTGDKYLRSRPMNRVVKPLRAIGANIDGRENGNLAPLYIRGGRLKPFRYESPIDSAQVKSALILAALGSDTPSYYKESLLSRDHAERMLGGMGVEISVDSDGWIKIVPPSKPLKPLNLKVPADPSSGFFFAVAAAIMPDSSIIIKDTSLNPTRIEGYKILERMGADIRYDLKEDEFEPIGDITVSCNGKLKAITVNSNIAWLIDELPALAIAMATAEGVSKVRNAQELRVKESDRILSVIKGLSSMGIEIEEKKDGYDIRGGIVHSAVIDSMGDHRIAMSFAIAGLLCGVTVEDAECIETSFPNFIEIMQEITEVKIEN